jgi:NYN domain
LYNATTQNAPPQETARMPTSEQTPVHISQSVAILVDGNNIERSIHSETGKPNTMLNFDTLVPRLLGNRGLNRLVYFREGRQISSKLMERLHANYHGSVRPCRKSADIPLSIKATQLANKVDTIIIMSGDSDYVELVAHLKSEGVRVEIAAVPSTTSRLLIEEADYFHEITQEDWFTLEPKKKAVRTPPVRRPEPPVADS